VVIALLRVVRHLIAWRAKQVNNYFAPAAKNVVVYSFTLCNIVVMKLSDYMEKRGLSATAMAAELDVAVSTVTRAAKGEIIPSRPLMASIYKATGGKVSAADFYDLEGKAA
jgi:hypothetical protein